MVDDDENDKKITSFLHQIGQRVLKLLEKPEVKMRLLIDIRRLMFFAVHMAKRVPLPCA